MEEDSEQQGILNKSNTTLGSMPGSSLGSAKASAPSAAPDEDKGWRLCHAESFLFFPGTDSIETLCVFVRGGRAV